MEWYIPITILPGIGLIILSASNLVIALDDELERHHLDHQISKEIFSAKLHQLKRLNTGLFLAYISAFIMVFTGIILGLSDHWKTLSTIAEILIICAVIIFSVSLFILSSYALKSARIRQKHLQENFRDDPSTST